MHPPSRHPFLAYRTIALVLAFLSISCSSKSSTPLDPLAQQDVLAGQGSRVAPASLPSGGEFYPLAVGNRWHLSRVFTLDYHGYGADTIRTSTDRVDIGTETRFGRTYFIEEETATQDTRPGEVFQSWTRYRQDRDGLHYLDVCACEPPVAGVSPQTATSVDASPILSTRLAAKIASERGGADQALVELSARLDRMRHAIRGLALTRLSEADPGEVTLLPYPIHVGKSWEVRPDFITFTVEGIEALETPAGKFPAYRIQVTVAPEGPEDFVRVWYGRAGQLAYHLHVEIESGYPATGYTADETEFVDYLSISRPGSPGN